LGNTGGKIHLDIFEREKKFGLSGGSGGVNSSSGVGVGGGLNSATNSGGISINLNGNSSLGLLGSSKVNLMA
jgi:hypothetical protein